MKLKLQRFTDFANALFPHEVYYLLSVQKFEDQEKVKILNLVHYNSKNPDNILPYDVTIDKRKYSSLIQWIEHRLNEIDVDVYFDWMSSMDKKINMDSILPEEEKQLFKAIKRANHTFYYFLRFYELIGHYRDYLLIRVRTQFIKPVMEYLEKYKEKYETAIKINDKINNAAIDIIGQHTKFDCESKQWEEELKQIFYNSDIDGYNRYKAVVRLTYIYYNYRDFDKLRDVYERLDEMLKKDIFYSKRILGNYYANRAMMHSKLNELKLSEKYGYLSIRYKNSDYLFYIINLCGVLLRQNKFKEALNLMTEAIPEMKKTSSFYNKIGFVSFYVRTLNHNNLSVKAESYAESFLNAYRKEVFNHRWHLFFNAYLQSLLKQEKFSKILTIIKRNNLIKKEKVFVGRARYLPVIHWYSLISEFEENLINEKELKNELLLSSNLLLKNKYKLLKINELIAEFSEYLPSIFKDIKHQIN
jgi:hypothetical protein